MLTVATLPVRWVDQVCFSQAYDYKIFCVIRKENSIQQPLIYINILVGLKHLKCRKKEAFFAYNGLRYINVINFISAQELPRTSAIV